MSGIYRHKGDSPEVSHEPVILVDAHWTPDGDGGWRIQNEECQVDARVKDGVSTVWTHVVICPTGEPTVNCGGVMRRFVNIVARKYFDVWFEKVDLA